MWEVVALMMPAPQRPGVAPLRTGVLLVEDDARIRQALGMALADAGYDIMEAATGEQALALLDSSKVDLIVLDVMLPGVDGLTICRTVRARSDLPIIIITARSDTSDVIEDLLRLPDRRYNDLYDLRGHLAVDRSGRRHRSPRR